MNNDTIETRYARLSQAILAASKHETIEAEIKAKEDAAVVVNAPSLAELLAQSAAKAKGKLVVHAEHTAGE
jgi:metal-dependent amidase/aminoacylase/carboxypeptidase family protein